MHKCTFHLGKSSLCLLVIIISLQLILSTSPVMCKHPESRTGYAPVIPFCQIDSAKDESLASFSHISSFTLFIERINENIKARQSLRKQYQELQRELFLLNAHYFAQRTRFLDRQLMELLARYGLEFQVQDYMPLEFNLSSCAEKFRDTVENFDEFVKRLKRHLSLRKELLLESDQDIVNPMGDAQREWNALNLKLSTLLFRFRLLVPVDAVEE